MTNRGIDPMRRFVGPEYQVLIPLDGLDMFEYEPSYAKDYLDMGIYKETYQLNPQAYVAANILNRRGRELGIRFRINDAWRPIETQIEKFILNKIKNPESTLFSAPFDEKFRWEVSDKDFILDFNDGDINLRFCANKDEARTPVEKARALANKLANDLLLSRHLRPTPHSVGGAMDMLAMDGRGNPLTQPKWLARKIWQDIQFIGRDFGKISDSFVLSMRTELEQLKDSEKDAIGLIEQKLNEKVKPLAHEILKKKKPMFTTHMEAADDAPEYLKNAVLNTDYLVKMADSIPNFTRTNDENWHFQCTDIRQFPIITIDMAKRASKAHVAQVKKECDGFAEQIYPLAYNREIKKGTEIILFKGVHFHDPKELSKEEFARSDIFFDKNNLIAFSEIKNKLAAIAARQTGR